MFIRSVIAGWMLGMTALSPAVAQVADTDAIVHGLDITFNVPSHWYLYVRGGSLLLTKDGELLQAVTLSKMKYGKTLSGIDRPLDKAALESEIGDLYIKSIEAEQGISDLEKLSYTPLTLNDLNGIELKYRYRMNEDAWMQGDLIVLKGSEYLYQISFRGTERVYFDRGVEGFDMLLTSLKILRP